uniref:Secreted protein n=1 Tax=Heterorhabditis bacteriophora TaxID=37862 RepID=A0A1I7WHA9_HETBA
MVEGCSLAFLLQSAVGYVRCSCANATRALRFFKEKRDFFLATRPFNPASTKRRQIDVILSEHSG